MADRIEEGAYALIAAIGYTQSGPDNGLPGLGLTFREASKAVLDAADSADASHREELAETLGDAREYLLTHRHIKDVDEADSILAGLILSLAPTEGGVDADNG